MRSLIDKMNKTMATVYRKNTLSLSIILTIWCQLNAQTNSFPQNSIVKTQDSAQNKIQILIDKASNGGTIHIPKGKYFINEALLISKDITLVGNGNVEIISKNADDDIINITSCNARLINIKARYDSTIAIDSCNGCAIWVVDGKNIYLEKCELYGCYSGVYGNWQYLGLKENYIHHNLCCAIYDGQHEINAPFSTKNITFDHNQFEYNGLITEKQIEENRDLFCEIEGFPEVEIPTGTKKAWIHYDRDSAAVNLLFKLNNNTFYRKTCLKQGLFIEVCYTLSAAFIRDTFWLGCVNSNGYEASSFLLYKNNQLIHLTDTMIDLNKPIKDRADLAYKNNKPIEYLQTLEGAQYYGQFLPDEGLYALRLADSLCIEFVKHGDYLKAAQLMDSLETNFDYTTSHNVIDDCYPIWIKAASYYLSAGMNEACIRLCKLLINEKIESADLFLYYGDALYNINLKTEASANYKKYLKLSNTKPIPKRVKKRVNKQ